MAAITLDIAGNTRQLDKDIQKTVNQVYTINLKTKGDQPLGRITGKINEFNKSLDASNARVIAFGASAGIIYGLERAFTALVSSTIEVQKSLQDINVILNASQKQLQAFGAELFSIARNTGQSFQEVAKAATEFSRQGLGVEETLKRTNEALILSRLSGLDTAKSVETLTAAVNSFASQAATATEIVNKFATVDAAFAVSSADLADAISRVGSSAAQSGVSLDELIAIVTSAQQTTARGGAVIGNSFKTIFTRLQREKVVDLLESLGISGTNASGEVKSTIQLLTELGKVYDTLGSQQQAYVAEQVGGVFQINILKAALADLGKEYSIYSSALNVSSGATDQAIRRNEELNKTYASQINALQENARQLAAAGGERLLGPSIDRLVGGTNTLLKGFTEADGQGVGAVLGKGILDGLGQFISGPGLALIGGVLLKLFKDLGKFATGSVQQLLGLNTAATQQRDLQASISQILAKNPQLLELALKGEQGLNAAANSLLANLQKQTVELQKQATVAAQISKAFMGAGVRVTGGVPTVPVGKTGKTGKAFGYIPNFASDKLAEKYTAISLGASSSVRPHMSQGTIGGKKFVMNNQEVEFPGVGKNGDSMVLPTYGDGPRIAAAGFIPNFAQKDSKKIKNVGDKYSYLVPNIDTNATLPPYTPQGGNVSLGGVQVLGPKSSRTKTVSDSIEEQVSRSVYQSAYKYANELQPLGRVVSEKDIVKGFNTIKGAKGAVSGAVGSAFEVAILSALDYRAAQREKGGDFDIRGGKNLARVQQLFGLKTSIADFKVSTERDARESFYKKIIKETGAGAFSETEKKQNARNVAINQLRNDPKWKDAYDSKGKLKPITPPGFSEALKVAEQKVGQRTGLLPFKKIKASGYIPNFALQDAIDRERAAGIPANQIYLAQEKALASANPMGLGVFNKLQEPTKQSRKDAMRRKGFARGYIPNFALEDPDTQAVSLETSIGAVAAQLSGLAFAFAFSKDQVKSALNDLTKSTKNAASAQRNEIAKEIRERRKLGKEIGGRSTESINKSINLDPELNAKRQEARKATKPSLGAKAGAAIGENAFALSIAAPILGETLKNLLGTETKGARAAGTVASAAGQVGSFAATGQMIGGKKGAGIGTVIGALLSIPDVVEAFVSDVPELTKSANMASQELTKFSEAGSRYFSAIEKLNAAIDSEGNGDPKIINAAREEYIKALSDLSVADQKALTAAEAMGTAQEKYAEILEEKISKERGAKAALDVGSVVAESSKSQAFTKYFGFIGRTIGRTGKFLNENLGPLGDEEGAARNQALIDYWSPESAFNNQMSADSKRLEQAFLDLALEGKSGMEAVSKIDEIQKAFIGSGKTGGAETADDLRSLLQQVLGTEDVGARDLTEQLVNDVQNNNLGPEAQKQAVQQIISILRLGLGGAREKNVQADISEKTGREQREKRIQILKQEQAAIDKTVASIQKNIAIQNLWTSSIENITESLRNFGTDFKIQEQLTNPRAALESVIGAEADPVRRLASQEGLAQINAGTQSGLATAGINFKESLRSSIQGPFQDNLNNIVKKLGESGGALQGTPDEIIKQSKEFQSQAVKEQQNLTQAMTNMEGLMSKFVSGQISSQQLLEASRAELSSVGIDINRGTKVSDEIEKAVAELEIATVNEQVKAFQQRAKLASETKQAILQNKINQALGVFGGFEGFMNRPEEEENYIERIGKDLKNVEKIRSSVEFRYGNKESIDARKEKSPELGRSFANVYRELIAQSGGAFKEFIQKTVDQGRQISGGMGGATGQLGGFDDIIAGREQDIKNQLQLAKDQLKVTKDPVIKRDLEGFIKSIETMPGGTKGIATLQTMQEFGVARQSDYKDLYGKFESQSLERLQEISPELAASLGDAVTLSNDPLVAEAQIQSNLQGEMIGYLDVIQKAILESVGIEIPESGDNKLQPYIPGSKNLGQIPNTGLPSSPSNVTGTLPSSPISLPGMPSSMPSPSITGQAPGSLPSMGQKSIAEIEAETTERRDMARGMGMSLRDYNYTFPSQKPEIGPAPSPDYEKYRELNKPGQSFKSKDDMLLNFLQRLNFKESGKILSPEQLGFGKKETQNLPTQNQSFTQQDAALSSNTAALNALNENLKNFGTKVSEQTGGNKTGNQTLGRAGLITATQPNVTTTTNAPVNVVVNAQGGNDVSQAVGEAVQNAIPSIIEKVKLAMGQKVPPTINRYS